MRPIVAVVGGFALAFGMFVAGIVMAAFILKAEPPGRPISGADVADTWTSEPKEVDVAAQNFERLPPDQPQPDRPQTGQDGQEAAQAGAAAAPAGSGAIAASDPGTGIPAVDRTTTASILPRGQQRSGDAGDDGRSAAGIGPEEDGDAFDAGAELRAAHQDWCSSRYRSYRASDNTYQPFSGGRSPCISPYLREASAAGAEEPDVFEREPGPGEGGAEFGDGDPVLQYASDGAGAGYGLSAAHIRDCMARYRSYRPEDNSYQPYGGGPRRQCE